MFRQSGRALGRVLGTLLRDPRADVRAGFSTKSAYPMIDHTYDAIVVGAGGAGLRAVVGLAEQGFKTA